MDRVSIMVRGWIVWYMAGQTQRGSMGGVRRGADVACTLMVQACLHAAFAKI